VDHLAVFGEAHLRRILCTYVAYYNQTLPRALQRLGGVATIPTDCITNTSGCDFRKGQPYGLSIGDLCASNRLARAAMEGRLDILTAVFEAASTKTLIHPNSMENR